MRDIDLFQLALGLVPPWMVAAADFDAEKKRLDIEIDFKTGGRFPCPECGKAGCPVHDTVKKTRRALPPNGERRSFRRISKELAANGQLTQFLASAVQATVEGPMRLRRSGKVRGCCNNTASGRLHYDEA